MRFIRIALISVFLVAFAAGAMAQGGFPLSFDNRLRVEYDDNIRQTDEDKDGSMKIINQLMIQGDMDMENTYISLRYIPSYQYWAERSERRNDINHSLDVILNQDFTPRLSLSVQDRLRYSQYPELRSTDEADLVIREDNTYLYNKLTGAIAYRMGSLWRVRVNAGHEFIEYRRDPVSASREDYVKYIGGFDLERSLGANTSIAGQLRYSQIDYDRDAPEVVQNEAVIDRGRGDRSSDQIQVGAFLQQVFNPGLIGSLRGGYTYRDYKEAYIDSEDGPYVDVSATYLPTPQTRLTVGGNHQIYDADVYPYVGQTRTSFYGSIGQDLTSKLDLFLSATYIMGDYDADEVVKTVVREQGEDMGGDDESGQLSARLRYNFYRDNYLELGYQLTDVSSDIRRDYTRNRYWVGWQTRL